MVVPLGSRDFTFWYQIRMKWNEVNTKQTLLLLFSIDFSLVFSLSIHILFANHEIFYFALLLLSVPFLFTPQIVPLLDLSLRTYSYIFYILFIFENFYQKSLWKASELSVLSMISCLLFLLMWTEFEVSFVGKNSTQTSDWLDFNWLNFNWLIFWLNFNSSHICVSNTLIQIKKEIN